MKAHAIQTEAPHLGFQIAPMIDVVFVIMLFFMVMAGAIKAERLLTATLPIGALVDVPPDEITIAVFEDGFVTLNGEEIAADTDTKLDLLNERLAGIRLDSKARGIQPLIIIQAEDTVRYQRIVDVVNVLEKVGLTHATFTLGTEE
jgi:biopolymer transport protein ExbD